jgi:predicted ATPase
LRPSVDTRVPFVGRKSELERLAASLDAGVSASLVGPGGVGKSRLALEAARRWARRTGGNVRFVGLMGVLPGEVAGTVASALDIAREPGRSALDALADADLSSPQAIILDNCEDALQAIGEVIERLRTHTAVVVLTTSRVRMRGNKKSFNVRPFNLRDGSDFFVARARKANFAVDMRGAEGEAVRQIVRRLDGLAVAIDLAAARLASLSVRELAGELAEIRLYNFRSTSSHDRRHWALTNVVNWSLEKLDPDALQLFTVVGRFAGVFNLDDLVGVSNGTMRAPAASLEELCEHSLVARIDDGRYTMLAPIRAVAKRRLQRASDRSEIEERFAAHFSELGSNLYSKLETSDGAGALTAIGARYDDFLSVLDWVLEQPSKRLPRMLGALGALVSIWTEGGRFEDGLRWYDRMTPVIESVAQPARGLILYGKLRVTLASYEYQRVKSLGTQLVSMYTITSDKLRLARTYNVLAVAALYTGCVDDAQLYADTALTLYQTVGEPNGVVSVLLNQGCIAMDGRNDPTAARKHFLAALEILSRTEADGLISLAQGNLAETAALAGDLDETERRARLALDGFSRAGNASRGAWAHCLLAHVHRARGDVAGAAGELLEAFALLEQQPNPDYLARCLETTAALLFANGRETPGLTVGFAARRFRQARHIPAVGVTLGDPKRELERMRGEAPASAAALAETRANALELRDIGRYARQALRSAFKTERPPATEV